MDQNRFEPNALLSSVFSDGTELFRQPAEPEPGDRVTLRLRVRRGADVESFLLMGFPAVMEPMTKRGSDHAFDWYEGCIHCGSRPVFYSFLVRWAGRYIQVDRRGARWIDAVPAGDPAGAFLLIPGFHVPQWAKGAVQYQIFPDRFRKGNPESDVLDREYWYAKDYIRHADSWDALPREDDFRCHYGGDLPGVMEKLDYLQSLGVEAIYFNPIFVSPSPHKYDTQDYGHIDPHLTVIPLDGGDVLAPGDADNTHAARYIRRTADAGNLEASDAWFASFCREVHRRGMKIILDGVFNHCGSFSRWMNREGVYGEAEGAFRDPESPFRGYFHFQNEQEYSCWWNVETLPKLCYEQSRRLCGEVFRAAEKWISPPYSVDGWRLDVGADLGMTPAFNHLFWKEFRRRVKAVNPDVLILAEHYGNPAPWLEGDEWDTVMNYDAFMDPLSFFLTGMEKHSDYRRDDLYQNGQAFFDSIFEAMAHLPTPSLHCAMDELDNHDHSRFMTRTNGRVGRLNTAGSEAAAQGVRPAVFREAAVIQMTWPGAPTIYYGDEAGLPGWTDPDNRRTYPWGREDEAMVEFYRALTALRRELPVLRRGSVKPLCAGFGHIAYARFDADECVIVACNNTDQPLQAALPLGDLGIPDGTDVTASFITAEYGFSASGSPAGTVEAGALSLAVPPCGAMILTPRTER